MTVKNIKVRDKGQTAGKLKGNSSTAMISNVTFNNIVMPGSATPASNLFQMNITDRTFYSPVTIFPVQTAEPRLSSRIWSTTLGLKQVLHRDGRSIPI